ncbi:MAG: hypothetical protein ACYDBJ_00900, partial [Aggregatilineales bacterium]
MFVPPSATPPPTNTLVPCGTSIRSTISPSPTPPRLQHTPTTAGIVGPNVPCSPTTNYDIVAASDTNGLLQAVQDGINYGINCSAGFTIYLRGGTYALPKGIDITYPANITIQGNDSTIEGSPSFTASAFIVNQATLTINHVIFQNARGSRYGGAIDNEITLTVNDSEFIGGTTVNGGGAIVNNGTLSAQRVLFQNNNAGGGGAIQSQGTLSVQCSVFSTNYAFYGGALLIADTPPSDMTTLIADIEFNSFTGNYITDTNATDKPGGDIYAYPQLAAVVNVNDNYWASGTPQLGGDLAGETPTSLAIDPTVAPYGIRSSCAPVPPVIIPPPPATPTPTTTFTSLPTLTPTPSNTLLPTNTPSNTPLPTFTPTPIPSNTPLPTDSLTPSSLPSNTPCGNAAQALTPTFVPPGVTLPPGGVAPGVPQCGLNPTNTPVPTNTPMPTLPPSPPPPAHTKSHYVVSTDENVLKAEGCADAQYNQQKGIKDAIIVLDYGYPVYKPSTRQFGATTAISGYFINLPFLPTTVSDPTQDSIEQGAEKFLQGYADCSTPDMNLTLAIGTNNDAAAVGIHNRAADDVFGLDDTLTPPRPPSSPYQNIHDHATAWAAMVAAVDQYSNNQGFGSRFTIAGAMDIETWGQSIPQIDAPVRAWVDAFAAAAPGTQYFNFGSCSDCVLITNL